MVCLEYIYIYISELIVILFSIVSTFQCFKHSRSFDTYIVMQLQQ